MQTKLILTVLAVFVTARAWGGETFSYADIEAGKFTQKNITGVRSMADGEHYTVMTEGSVVRYRYSTGEVVDTLVSAAALGSGEMAGYELSADERKVLLSLDAKPLYRRSAYSRYVVLNLADGVAEPLVRSDSVRFAAFSPDGDRVAYVLRNDIYIKDITAGTTTRVTADGRANHVINGMPDWVYEEEWVMTDALRWSPDGKRVAFLRFDESRVREFTFPFYNRPSPTATQDAETTVMRPDEAEPTLPGNGEENLARPTYPGSFTYKYPRAGEENSVVSLRVYDLSTARTTEVDLGPETDQYVPFFGWTPAGGLYYYRVDRLQRHLEVFLAEADADVKAETPAAPRLIYEEHSDKYIDDIGAGTVTFLSDSRRFIVANETATGWAHLYMYDVRRGLLYPITAGEWEVEELVYATDKRIWYTSTEGSPLRTNLYSVDIRGARKRRLSTGEGTYRVSPSRHCNYYLSYFSNVRTPLTVTLHDGDGKLIRTLEDNAELKAYLARIDMPVKEFGTFETRHGDQAVALDYYMMKPPGFDPSRRYPVLLTQYSGPGSREVSDRWAVEWDDALVQEGYIVVCVDPRGTAGHGERFKKLTYGRMGLLETEDQINFARHIASLPYVDGERIGIYGWSYGGFMALNCILKGADVFRMAISVAPVTSWRYYDSVYTERVNGLPQDNPEGYDAPSPIYHADSLRGKLLMMFGTADDNVHALNGYKMAYELTRAGRPFDMMTYTDDNHSMMPLGRHHIRHKMVEYCLGNL